MDGGAGADLDWILARDAAVLLLLYGSGLRISEALGLLRKDAPLEGRDVLRITGKGGKERLVPVLPVTQAGDRAATSSCAPYALAPDGPLFLGAKGGRLSPRIVQLLMARMRGGTRPASHGDAARPASLVRDPPAVSRSRSAPDPGAAGPRQPVHHPGLYRSRPRAPAGRLRQGPPRA